MAFVGAGGKTTALFKAARELLNPRGNETTNNTVLVTTTTHFGSWQREYADHFFRIHKLTDLLKLEANLPAGVVMLAGDESDQRLVGLSAETLERVRLFTEEYHLPLLIEADGSGKCPLKAPAAHEPAIPEFSQIVVVVEGLSGLGKPLTKEWVHRPEIFAKLSGLNIGELITAEALIKVFQNKDGGLKNIPSTARKVALLNQADNSELQAYGRKISQHLIPDFHLAIIASLSRKYLVDEPDKDKEKNQQGGIHAVVEPIAGVILAAGGSSRFGKPKQLLPWKGLPLIRHVTIAAMKAGLSPIYVVVGSSAEETGKAISDLPLRIVNNAEWITGLSSSIRAGVAALPKEVGGVIFLQADQPQTSPLLIKSLIEVHQESLSPIIAPQIDGQRGNPVLFDIKTFPDLLNLKGDMGGRTLFSYFPIRWITWHDPKQLMDIDTPEDFTRFLDIYPEGETKL